MDASTVVLGVVAMSSFKNGIADCVVEYSCRLMYYMCRALKRSGESATYLRKGVEVEDVVGERRET